MRQTANGTEHDHCKNRFFQVIVSSNCYSKNSALARGKVFISNLSADTQTCNEHLHDPDPADLTVSGLVLHLQKNCSLLGARAKKPMAAVSKPSATMVKKDSTRTTH
jgi:hypothetical protein